MWMVDIKLFVKNEKEPVTLIQTIRIYSHNIEMEFGIEICAALIMKSVKRQRIEWIKQSNQEKNQNSRK